MIPLKDAPSDHTKYYPKIELLLDSRSVQQNATTWSLSLDSRPVVTVAATAVAHLCECLLFSDLRRARGKQAKERAVVPISHKSHCRSMSFHAVPNLHRVWSCLVYLGFLHLHAGMYYHLKSYGSSVMRPSQGLMEHSKLVLAGKSHQIPSYNVDG